MLVWCSGVYEEQNSDGFSFSETSSSTSESLKDKIDEHAETCTVWIVFVF